MVVLVLCWCFLLLFLFHFNFSSLAALGSVRFLFDFIFLLLWFGFYCLLRFMRQPCKRFNFDNILHTLPIENKSTYDWFRDTAWIMFWLKFICLAFQLVSLQRTAHSFSIFSKTKKYLISTGVELEVELRVFPRKSTKTEKQSVHHRRNRLVDNWIRLW